MPVTSIGVRNFSRVQTSEVMDWAAATQKQIERDVRRFWNIPVPKFTEVSTAPDPGPLGDIDSFIYVVNNVAESERLGLGWHRVIDGRPIAFVVVDFIEGQNPPQTPSRVFSHEVLEMAIDPEMQLKTALINNTEFLVEVGDVLSFDAGAYSIDGVMVSGFGTPAYFHFGDGQVFAFRGDDNGDPVGGQLPARAPEDMGTMLCWVEAGQLKTALLSAALPEGDFPEPDLERARALQPFQRRARRMLPEEDDGPVLLKPIV